MRKLIVRKPPGSRPFNFADFHARGAAGLPTGACRDLTYPRDGPSVVILRVAILRPGLPVMALLAEWLPVVLIPEELLISAVRNDMINYCCLDVSSRLGAFSTKRMNLKEPFAFLLPLLSVSTA